MFNFSKSCDLSISGHKDIPFVDVPIDTDVKLTINPALIKAGKDLFSRVCMEAVNSFFDEVFSCCHHRDYEELSRLLSHSGEPNETHLGSSTFRSQGRGASVDILLTVFTGMINQGIFDNKVVENPCDIYVLAPNFDKDRMSDLLTNILREPLERFTAEECIKWGIPLYEMPGSWSWDAIERKWKKGQWSLPVVDGIPVMLVPKWFVSRNYHFGTGSYISKYLLEFLQKYHLDNNTNLCYDRELKSGKIKRMPPTKKEVRAFELPGKPLKQHATEFACEYPDTMRRFCVERTNAYATGDFFMTDLELDQILYANKSRTA